MSDLFVQARRGKLPAGHDPETLKSARDIAGRTLLHVCNSPDVLSQLLAFGLDVNARDRAGLTPLMTSRSPECNRVLLAGGADVQALDAKGNSVLAHQSGALMGCIGYVAPDFQALDLLVAAGAAPPSQEQAESWIAEAHAQVCAATEHGDACCFESWLRRLYS